MIPSADRLEDPQKFDVKMIEIRSWGTEGTKKEDGIARIQLNFTQPEQVSQGLEHDSIEIKFLNEDLKQLLKESSLILTSKCIR